MERRARVHLMEAVEVLCLTWPVQVPREDSDYRM